MRLFLKFSYDVPNTEMLGSIYKRIQNYFLDVYEVNKVWFEFYDSFVNKHRGSSAGLEKMPELKDFLFFLKQEWGNSIYEEPVISNLDETWQSPNPYKNLGDLQQEHFMELMNNIPKRYPFLRASYAFDLYLSSVLNSIPNKENPVHESYKRGFSHHAPLSCSSLILEHISSDNKRNNLLAFYLRLPSNVFFEETLPVLPSSVLNGLCGIGEIKSSELFYISDDFEFSQIEKKRKQAHALLGEQGQNFYDELLNVKKPNELPEPFFVLKDSMQPSSKRKKKIAIESIVKLYLGLKGYHYRPRLDTEESITFSKSTKNHNALNVVFHFGSWSKKLSCTAVIKGLSWEERIQIPFFPDYHQYPIASEETFKKAVENMAAVVMHIEKQIAPQVEEIYGSSPAWFRADGDVYKLKTTNHE